MPGILHARFCRKGDRRTGPTSAPLPPRSAGRPKCGAPSSGAAGPLPRTPCGRDSGALFRLCGVAALSSLRAACRRRDGVLPRSLSPPRPVTRPGGMSLPSPRSFAPPPPYFSWRARRRPPSPAPPASPLRSLRRPARPARPRRRSGDLSTRWAASATTIIVAARRKARRHGGGATTKDVATRQRRCDSGKCDGVATANTSEAATSVVSAMAAHAATWPRLRIRITFLFVLLSLVD